MALILTLLNLPKFAFENKFAKYHTLKVWFFANLLNAKVAKPEDINRVWNLFDVILKKVLSLQKFYSEHGEESNKKEPIHKKMDAEIIKSDSKSVTIQVTIQQ